MAAGRAVNTGDIGLEKVGVKLTDRGFIQVDPATLQTTVKGSTPSVTSPARRCWPTRAPARAYTWPN